MRDLAKDIIEGFSDGKFGRPMLGLEGAVLLMECVRSSSGDYIEIGSAYGGSAIMAASAMDGPGTVFCIDPFGMINDLEGLDHVYFSFWMNIQQYDVQQRIIVFKQHHPPFPAPIHYHTFSVGLIDGSHLKGHPTTDFRTLNPRVSKYLLFDNSEIEYVQDAISEALDSGSWEKHKIVEYDSLLGGDKIVEMTALRRIQE